MNKFEGQVCIEFNLSNIQKTLFLDFAGNAIYFEINGQSHGVAKDGEKLYLKKEYLNLGKNIVKIEFENFYSHVNKGLCFSHDDQLEKKSYVFTNTEPCYTHLLFPCFNQPSIKAKINFNCATMESWIVIGSTNLSKKCFTKDEISTQTKELANKNIFVPIIENNFILHSFDPTEKIPVHLFGFTAGHFKKALSSNNVNIYMKADLIKKSDEHIYELIAKTVECSFEWINKNLASSKFKKNFNICFVPNLDSQSISASGCFIMDDDLINDQNSTYQKILLHLHLIVIVAQLWFGVDVTPKWWDDIWISKSISIFLAYHILQQLSEDVIFYLRKQMNILNLKIVGYYFLAKK